VKQRGVTILQLPAGMEVSLIRENTRGCKMVREAFNTTTKRTNPKNQEEKKKESLTLIRGRYVRGREGERESGERERAERER
jgi:hypothetical protein